MSGANLQLTLPAPAAQLAEELAGWYASNQRSLPWRGSRDPYAIWVSEVMLQQTQGAVVAPYYARFLDRFPTVAALAGAPLPDVLGLWSGLGYYARARSLHAAAQAIAARGDFPRTLEGLRALPGFGPYTAAAVGSIAFDLPEPAIDGNAVRVYARLTGLSAPRPLAEARLREAVRPLIAAGDPGDLNQAIMDLGQAVCLRTPRCLLCPWRANCVAHRAGTTAVIPLRVAAKPRKALTWSVALLRRRGRVLLARRREAGLFGGLWELPGAEVSAGDLGAALRDSLGLEAEVGEPLASVAQVLTHRELRLVAHAVRARGRPAAVSAGPYLEARFMALADLPALGISSATRKLLAALGLSLD